MKIRIDEREIEIIDVEVLYTGNARTYIVDIEFVTPEIFDGFDCNIVFTNGNVSRKEIIGPDMKVKIPAIVLEEEGDLIVGFFAIKKDDDCGLKRYSSEIDTIPIETGGYNRHASYTEDLTPTILEKYTIAMKQLYDEYISEFKELYNSSTELNNETKELKVSIEQSEENAKQSEKKSKESENKSKEYLDQVVDIAQSVPYAGFEINEETGELSIISPERFGNMGFELNEKGELEVEIGG